MMTENQGLHVRDLVIGYGQPISDPLTFQVPPGNILAILGPSGCGKSTLLSTIAGVIPALSGSVTLNGRDVTSMATAQRRAALVFQEPLLFPHLNVRDNVAYGPRRRGLSRAAARAEADRLLDWVDLASLASSASDQLSGGQAQRVALARAFAAEPQVLCLDEPFSALDAPLRQRLAADVVDFVRTSKVPAIHVTHDPQEADSLAASTPDGSILSM